MTTLCVFDSDDLLLMSTPPSGKDRHPAARTLAERVSADDDATAAATMTSATTNGEVDKMLAYSPQAADSVSVTYCYYSAVSHQRQQQFCSQCTPNARCNIFTSAVLINILSRTVSPLVIREIFDF